MIANPKHRHRDEQGSTLMLTLVFMALFGTLVAALLSFGDVSLNLNDVQESNTNSLYAADGAVEWATKATLTNDATCPLDLQGAGRTLTSADMALPTDVPNVKVSCTQLTGPGSNTFAGYTVVTGTHQVQSNDVCSSFATSLGTTQKSRAKLQSIALCTGYDEGLTTPDWVRYGEETFGRDRDITGYDIDVLDMYSAGPDDWWTVGYGSGSTPGSYEPRVYWGTDAYDFQRATGRLPASAAGSAVNAVTDVWGADGDHVWVVTTEAVPNPAAPLAAPANQKPLLWFSADSNNQPTTNEVWDRIEVPAARTLDDVFGVVGDATGVWVTGSDTSDQPALWRCTSQQCLRLTNLGLPSDFLTGRALAGFAVDSQRLHLVGAATKNATDTALSADGRGGLAWATTNAGSTWATPQLVNGSTTLRLNGISGLSAEKIWATGFSTTNNKHGTVSAFKNSSWTAPVQIDNTGSFSSVFAAGAASIWVAGEDQNGNGRVWRCGSGYFDPLAVSPCVGTAANQWTPTGSVPGGAPRFSVAAAQPTANDDFILVGGRANWVVSYAPFRTSACPPTCKAEVLGGPIFNTNYWAIGAGLNVPMGVEQYGRGSTLDPCTPTIPSPVISARKTCVATIPETLRNWEEPLPKEVQDAAGRSEVVDLPRGNPCAKYTVYYPGKYSDLDIKAGGDEAVYFKSGVYHITGKLKLDGGGYVIGGRPAVGDVIEIASHSPCWSAIQQSDAYKDTGAGTGATFIMSGSGWWDVHTTNLEIFTRTGGSPEEGAQGISIRESCTPRPSSPTGSISGPSCKNPMAGSETWPSSNIADTRSKDPNEWNQIWQADSGDHDPWVNIHGRSYLPNHNLIEWTSTRRVTLGAIWANSVELIYQTLGSPPARVSGGSPGEPTAVITATSGTTTVQAFVPFKRDPNDSTLWVVARGANAVADRPYSWRILSIK